MIHNLLTIQNEVQSSKNQRVLRLVINFNMVSLITVDVLKVVQPSQFW